MKLKSLIAFAGVACAAASYGDATTVSTDNTLCRIKFTTSEKEVLIGLPLVDVGGTTQTINATNYISTVGLPKDTQLLGKVDGKWYSWTVANANDAWTPVTTVNDNDNEATIPDNLASFTRGGAVRLIFPSKPDTTQAVYLYGQVANASTTGTAAITASRDSEKATYTLLSNINPSGKSISDLSIANSAAGDKIAVLSSNGTGQKEYTWSGSAWKEDVYTTKTVTIMGFSTTTVEKTTQDANKTFAAGEGFFYIAAPGNGGNPTFTWN